MTGDACSSPLDYYQVLEKASAHDVLEMDMR